MTRTSSSLRRGAAEGDRPRDPARRSRRRPRRPWSQSLTPWLFLLVPLALLATFSYVPIINMVVYSFTDWDGVSPGYTFTGLENYAEILTRPELFKVFVASAYYLGASVVQIVLALYFATVLSFSTRFRNLFKGILFFPYLINGVAIGFVFLYFFQEGGTFDTVLRLFGIGGEHLWLGDPDLVNFSLAGVSVWRYLGLNFVLFLGAIQSIAPELYEAAELDGASRWQQFRFVIAPSLRPIIGLTAILAISGSLSVFEIPYIMTGGAGASETFVIQTIKLAFRFNKTGLASAAAVVLLVIILLVAWAQRRLVPEERVTPS
ncbi:sugar ABC transporter permease [Actinomadura sp. ATCC 31491]|uniref:Sugar ABC transporter permease n=1 Tax=Actinomadura luzonensis TaxID=2805427 RepID=A0ABT0FVH4_9ACTN|nr:sugar ABC transporter permease [Actinomadura luzonensis]MCK2216335.1 sugar ABC transporter permease [Actinomadura luzonensis]